MGERTAQQYHDLLGAAAIMEIHRQNHWASTPERFAQDFAFARQKAVQIAPDLTEAQVTKLLSTCCEALITER